MRKLLTPLALALALFGGGSAAHAQSLNLSNYSVSAIYALDALNGTSGGISGLEASAVTYAKDRGSLFFVGDEGTGVVEISLTGKTLGYMNFDWTNTGSTHHDTESLAYLGNGTLVVGEERLYDAYKFNYAAGGTAQLITSSVSISNAYPVDNNGMEGLAYDPRNGGSYIAVKQQSPENVLSATLTFGGDLGGTATVNQLFDPAKLGLATLSDVAVLSTVDSLAGTAGADHLLFLSLGSRRLVETDRSGNVLSSFDLSNILPNNAIEGVTVDEKGNIYLVAEQQQDGVIPANPQSQLIVLSAAAVPEPASATLMVIGAMSLLVLARKRREQQR